MSEANQIETNHSDIIHDAQPDYYGKRLATCSSDKSIKIFSIVSEEEQKKGIKPSLLAELKGHFGPVWQVAWAHPSFGSLLASCSFDHTVKIWAETYPSNSTPASLSSNTVPSRAWRQIFSMSHNSSVNSICWAPSELGACLVSGSSDGSISLIYRNPSNPNAWITERVSDSAHKGGCNCVSWAPSTPTGELTKKPSSNDQEEIGENNKEVNLNKRIVSGGCDNEIKIWGYKEKQGWFVIQDLKGHNNWVRDVAWAPNIGLPFDTIASCSNDKKVIIWRKNFDEEEWTKKELPEFEGIVWKLSWSISGNVLAVSTEKNVSLWKEVDGEWYKISSIDENSGNENQ